MSGTESIGRGAPCPDAPEDFRRTRPEVLLEGFVIEVLESMAQSRGPYASAEDLHGVIDRALARYFGDRELAPPGWACLPLAASDSPGGGPPLTVLFDERLRMELCAEAEAQGVKPEALVAHAVMYTWAAERAGRRTSASP